MGRAKDIIVKVISKNIADSFVRKVHYSGKVDPRSNLHLGVFLDGMMHGVMQFGISIDKNKVIHLVKDTGWNEFIELNRMAFDDYLPKNSESRAIAIAIKLIKKNAPHIKWIISYADGTQCGDGTIYRASGFLLTQINDNKSMWRMPDNNVICKIVLEPSFGTNAGGIKAKYGKVGQYSSWTSTKFLKHIGAKLIGGYQLRYIYLIDKTAKLNVPIIPFEKIDELGAGMYKGEKITMQQRKVNMDQSV
jgi:hypothetical protein